MNAFWHFIIPMVSIPLGSASSVVFWRSLGLGAGKPFTWWIENAIIACILSGMFGAAAAAVIHDPAFASGSAIVAVAAACTWFLRKRRDRIKALIGAKSRALRDALVARMPTPRPVLQGGAP